MEIQPENNDYYDNLLHSINHPHLKDNHDRHILILEKWCMTYADGLFIKDMKYVKEIFTIVREKLITHTESYTALLPSILNMCAKVLLSPKEHFVCC